MGRFNSNPRGHLNCSALVVLGEGNIVNKLNCRCVVGNVVGHVVGMWSSFGRRVVGMWSVCGRYVIVVSPVCGGYGLCGFAASCWLLWKLRVPLFARQHTAVSLKLISRIPFWLVWWFSLGRQGRKRVTLLSVIAFICAVQTRNAPILVFRCKQVNSRYTTRYVSGFHSEQNIVWTRLAWLTRLSRDYHLSCCWTRWTKTNTRIRHISSCVNTISSPSGKIGGYEPASHATHKYFLITSGNKLTWKRSVWAICRIRLAAVRQAFSFTATLTWKNQSMAGLISSKSWGKKIAGRVSLSSGLANATNLKIGAGDEPVRKACDVCSVCL